MDTAKTIRWVRTALVSSVSGGIMAAIAAACDPSKYRFPADLGSGRLWPFFLAGAGAMFAGALLRSPFGQSAMQSYQDARAELEQAKQDIDKAKAALKPPSNLKPTKEITMTDKPTTPETPPATPPTEPPQPPKR